VSLPPPASSSTALVTGASSGIGAELARELGRRGHNLILVARRADRLAELAAELGRCSGIRAETIAADLGDADERDRLAAEVASHELAVEVLVNCAGFGSTGDLQRDDREALLAMVRLNCEALLDLQARYSPGMAERGRGAIINLASTAAFQPMPSNAAYAASKAFVLSLGEATHAELSQAGVAVTVVCPGPVKTEFADVAGIANSEDRVPGFVWTPVEDVARAAVEGAEHGRRVVVPGLLNRAGAISGQHAPRALALPLVKRIWSRAL
jgi:short-subunit dehydrogenase